MTANASKTRINWPYATSVVVTYMFMIGTAAVSFSHIVSVATTLGLSWEAWTTPFLVDGIALLGLVGRSPRFAPSTRRAGLVLVTVGGLLSLTCNVMAGHNIGQRAYGVLIVGGFMLTEWYAGKLRPAATPADEVHAKRSAAATKGAATRKANQAASMAVKAPSKPRKPRAPRATPVSPATVQEIEAALSGS